MHCKNCGNKLNGDEAFCGKCGSPINSSTRVVEEKSKSNSFFSVYIKILLIAFLWYFIFAVINLVLRVNIENYNDTIKNIIYILEIVVPILMCVLGIPIAFIIQNKKD